MRTRMFTGVSVAVVTILVCASVTLAAPPWKKLIPFKSVDADPNKSYWVTEDNGPWMILAASFAGPGAEQQAHTLVLELRKQFKFDAYMHKRHFDFTAPVYGKGVDKYGRPKRMTYRKATKFDEIAVLVGNYTAYDAPGAAEDLEKIKTAKPDCLGFSNGRGKKTTQRFVGIRELQRLVHADPEKRELGKMRAAFIGRNPLLPKEYFVAGGIDPFVLKMNKRVEHSLLNNPGAFTVRVASFQGESYFKGEDESESGKKRFFGLAKKAKTSKLELAADNAHRLTLALRRRGIEAYEFHDRFESVVTIGSFDSVGTQLPSGKIDLHPKIYQIMQQYGGQRKRLPGQSQGVRPKMLDGIPFDVQPMPVKVPRRSIAADYAAGARQLR